MQKRPHRGRRLLLHVWQDVGVGVERDLRRGRDRAALQTTCTGSPACSSSVAQVCRSAVECDPLDLRPP